MSGFLRIIKMRRTNSGRWESARYSNSTARYRWKWMNERWWGGMESRKLYKNAEI